MGNFSDEYISVCLQRATPLAAIPSEAAVTEHLCFTETSPKSLLNFFIAVSLQTCVAKFCLWKDYQPPGAGLLRLFSAAISSVPQHNLGAFALPAVPPVTPPRVSAPAAFLHSAGLAGRRGGEALGI